MDAYTAWQYTVITHARHIGPFICPVRALLLEQVANREYQGLDPDQKQMFEELDNAADAGILSRTRIDTGIQYALGAPGAVNLKKSGAAQSAAATNKKE